MTSHATPAATKVHNGFLAAYKTLRAATTVGVAAALHLCGDDCSVLFTGHSLGAAMVRALVDLPA